MSKEQAYVLGARAVLSHFTPERPMFVGPAMLEAMRAETGLADMMNRVRLISSLPTGGSTHPSKTKDAA